MSQNIKVMTEVQLNKFLKRLRDEKKKIFSLHTDPAKTPSSDLRIILDYYLFSVISNTGMRISESLNLTHSDIGEGFVVIKPEFSKNKRRGTILIGPRTQKLIEEFLSFKKLAKPHSCGPESVLFSLKNKPLSRSACHIRFKQWMTVCSLPHPLSIHSLRHTYATLCLDKGFPLTLVRDNLRHSNISVTSRYLHLTPSHRKKINEHF